MRSHTPLAAVPADPGRSAAGFLTGAAGTLPNRSVVVLDAIKHAILTGELRPGQGLVETDLAGMLGVSKTPVREAFKTLAGAGLVTMSPYKGATVRAVDDDLVRSVYDLRLLLEPEAVGRAVARNHCQTAAARDALNRAARATDRADRSLANRDFHRALYLGCGNAMLVSVLDDLRDQTALVSAAAWRRAPTWRGEAAEHRAIFRAATAGDADGAARLLTGHIESFLARNYPSLAETESLTETGDTDAP
jgi:DNA-binding GntR family transcriptional regulator